MTKALPVTIEHGDYLESSDGAVTSKRYLKVICMQDTVLASITLTGSVTGQAHVAGPTYAAGTVIRGGIVTGLEVTSGQVFCVTGMSEVT